MLSQSIAKLHNLHIKSNSLLLSPPTLIGLHGLCGSHNNFRSLCFNEKISNLVQSYLLDLRNHGKSQHKNSMNIEEMAEDIQNFVLEKKLNDVVIMGHSLGGKIAMSLATNPNFQEIQKRIKGIIIIDVSPVNYMEKMKKGFTIDNDHNLEMFKKINVIKLMNRDYIELKEEVIHACQNKNVGELMWTNIEYEKKNFKWRINLPVIIEYYGRMLGHVPNEGHHFDGKLKIFKGEKSNYVKKEYLSDFKSFFPNFKYERDVVSFTDAGHWLHYEKPYEFLDKMNITLKEML